MHLYSKLQRRLRRRRLWHPLARRTWRLWHPLRDRPTASRKVDAHRGPAVPGATPAVAIIVISIAGKVSTGRRPTAGPPATPRRSGGRPRPNECPGGRRRRGMPPTATPPAGHDAEQQELLNRCIRAATPTTTMRDEGSISVASESPWSQKAFSAAFASASNFISVSRPCVHCVICAVKSLISAVKEATSASLTVTSLLVGRQSGVAPTLVSVSEMASSTSCTMRPLPQ